MDKIESEVRKIIERVKKDGDDALCLYTRKFDGISLKPSAFSIAAQRMKQAFETLDKRMAAALKTSIRNINMFYQKEKQNIVRNWSIASKNKIIRQQWVPLESAGIYVPGGSFSYPSTVLMAVVPAKIAGVKRIVMISPPKKITDIVLAAAWMAGVDELYQIGGPAGIAALAYGTKTISPVDKIIGPGNIYVTMAKKLVYGHVGIDMLAGPSEIAIIADSARDAEYIIEDVRAQLEHDSKAHAFVISLNAQLTARIRKNCPGATLMNVHTIAEAASTLNRIAPEHTELMTRKNNELLKRITASGTICVGRNTPVAISDYCAGPSHILPTGRSARFSSGLSIIDFYKRISVVRYRRPTPDFYSADLIAESEGMRHHQRSLQRRLGL